MDYYKQFFHNFKDASHLARALSHDCGRTIKVNRHVGGYNVHVPRHLYARAMELLSEAAESLVNQRVNVGAFSAGILMLMDRQRADSLLAEDSLVVEAFRRSDSGLSDATVADISEYLSAYTPEQQAGIINNVKGIYHELAFVAAENSDGDAWSAEIMPMTNHPGVDVLLSNPTTGEVVELQLKATDSPSYVAEAATKNPDVTILTTSEVAQGGREYGSTGFTNEGLIQDVEDAVTALQSSAESAGVSELLGVGATAGVITALLAGAKAVSGKAINEEDLVVDVGKALVRGVLFSLGVSLL